MKTVKHFIFLSFYLCVLSCTAFADKQYNQPSKADHIALFPDNKILAVSYENNKEIYRIGELGGAWSDTYQISDLGMEYVTFTLPSDNGVYISGEVANKKAGSNTNYTGRTVLINKNNKLIKTWDYDLGFNSVFAFNNDIIGSTGNKVFKLLQSGKVELMHQRNRKTLITLALGKQGELIICNNLPIGKRSTIGFKFGCNKADDWEFTGYWHGADNVFNTAPIRCGDWLIEAEQKKFRTHFSKLKIRNIDTGKLLTEQEIPKVSSFICADNNHLLLNTSNTGYSLPELTPAIEYSCHGEEKIKSIKHAKSLSICLTEQGNIGKLKAKHKK